MGACLEHRSSKDPQWRQAMSLLWQNEWGPRQADVDKAFGAVASKFTRKNRNGKETVFQNWSGKTLRQIAVEVDHVEAYDIFYSELSSFTRVDVHLANRFLRSAQMGRPGRNGPTKAMLATSSGMLRHS
jgi:hypothetical protein